MKPDRMQSFPMLRKDHCPFCRHASSFVTCVARGVVPREPVPGDFTLCRFCGEWMVFDEARRLRKPTEIEYLKVVEPTFQLLRSAWAEWANSNPRRVSKAAKVTRFERA